MVQPLEVWQMGESAASVFQGAYRLPVSEVLRGHQTATWRAQGRNKNRAGIAPARPQQNPKG